MEYSSVHINDYRVVGGKRTESKFLDEDIIAITSAAYLDKACDVIVIRVREISINKINTYANKHSCKRN